MFLRFLVIYRYLVEYLGEVIKFFFFLVLEIGRKEFFRGNKDNIIIEYSWDLD